MRHKLARMALRERQATAEPCSHLGAEITGAERQRFGLNHLKLWHHCDHPRQPLGPNVCACEGCGPTCSGYNEQLTEIDLATYFDRVVVLNLARRPERLERFRAQPWPFRDLEVFPAIDGRLLPVPRKIPYSWGLQTPWPENDHGNGGHASYGCSRSHQHVLERAILDGVKRLLVFEDDAEWGEDFGERLLAFMRKVPSNWDQLMIGGQLIQNRQREQVCPGVLRIFGSWRTHCYAIQGRFLRDAYQWLCSSVGHVDDRFADMHSDPQYRIYAPTPFLVAQGANLSDITNKNEPRRNWS